MIENILGSISHFGVSELHSFVRCFCSLQELEVKEHCFDFKVREVEGSQIIFHVIQSSSATEGQERQFYSSKVTG